jgi:DNA polymerase-1
MTSKVPYANCDACPFKDRPLAKSVGNPDAELVIVSRSPGYYEALNGKCFEGPSGKVLDHLLQLQGMNRSNTLLTNVVLCQSDGPTDDGWDAAVRCCAPRLDAETAQAATVIAAGAEALQSLKTIHIEAESFVSGGIHANRGYAHSGTHFTSGKEQRIIVTNNPAMVLRDDATYPELVRDFKLAINPLPRPKLPTVKWIEDIDEARTATESILNSLTAGTVISCDIEARGTNGQSGLSQFAEIVCAGFSTRPERAVVFGESVCQDESFRRDYLDRLYTRPDLRYLWHNGKYDIKVLRTSGINARVDEDSLLLSWCLDERPGNPESGAGGHSLEWLLKDVLGWPKYEPPSVKHFKKTGELPDKRARIDLYEYNGMDTAGALGLFNELKVLAKNDNVWDRPYRSLLIRLSEALTRIELQGIIFDAEAACDILEQQVWPKLAEQKAYMRDLSSLPVLNPNSPKQLESLIYDGWGIKHTLSRPKIERKGKRSTDKAVRQEILRGDYSTSKLPMPDPRRVELFTETLDNFKELDKQRGTYLEGLVLKRNKDGRIYTNFKIHGTESGRLSGSEPNMQNITRPKEGLPNIRRAFVPDPGCVFISGDLSQAELRAISVLSGSANLRSIYLDTNRSLHKETATAFYGDNYTYEQYVRSKNINFGVVYWQSAYSFAQMYHMPEKEAEDYIKWWFDRFDGVWDWTKSIEKQVLDVGEIQSPFGHKRRFYVIPSDQSGKLHTVKQGINFLPQNIAGNITLWALCNICEKLDWDVAQPRITVHDNIVVNCRRSHVPEVTKIVKEEMERAVAESIDWDFPFLADITVGETWGDLVDYNE